MLIQKHFRWPLAVMFLTMPISKAYFDSCEDTPLMKAAFEGNIDLMKKLIKSGEDVHAVAFRDQPHGGKPVLRYAIDSHCLESVSILLNAGANPNEFTESPIITTDGKSNVSTLIY